MRCGKTLNHVGLVSSGSASWARCILPEGHGGPCRDIGESSLDYPRPIELVKPPDPLDKVRSAVRTLTAAAAERDDYMLDELAEALSAIEATLVRLTARMK